MLTRSVRTPIHEAMSRFCMTARMSKPSGVRVNSNQTSRTMAVAKPITKRRFHPKSTSLIVKFPLSQLGE